MKRTTLYTLVLLASLLSACRRDLWVYTDQFRQVELVTDWTEATERPGGMTWWFMNCDYSARNYHGTTAEVTHSWLGLPRGQYDGVIFDYSPSEYSHQEFVNMTHADSALVRLRPSADQPGVNQHLYGEPAVPSYLTGIPHYTPTGMYQLAAEPEIMNADTIRGVTIVTGTDEDRILWKERDDYEASLTTQTLQAKPRPLVWQLRVVVHVRGIGYMNSVHGSVAGLADGCWLGPLRHTGSPCLQALDAWTRRSTGNNEGYITTTIRTFGLPDLLMPPSSALATRTGGTRADDQTDDETQGAHIQYSERLQLNLQFLLRDEATIMNYHFDVGQDCITINDDKLEVELVIPVDYPGGIPDLPEVEAKGGTGFDADVTPWVDGGTADETM